MGYAAEKQWKGNVNGKTAIAELTGYYPANNAMEGGFNDCIGKRLDPTQCVCAAPKDVPRGTLVKFSGTGTDIDGKIYRVVDRGGAIVHGNCNSCGGDRYCFDILFPDKKTCDSFGRKHGCKVQFGDVVDDNGELTSTGSSSDSSTSSMLKTTRSFKTNPATDWLLDPTEDEKRYGINIYEGEQPLIKFSTYTAISQHGNCVGALKKYCEFLYYLLNSEVTTAQVTCVGMPWIRPGFNIWLDPLYSDAIYYCTNVQHQGDPSRGATTSLTLCLGRSREAFINDSDRFGSFKSNSDNVFISDMKDEYRVNKFGTCLDSAESFEAVKTASENYYGTESFETVDAKDSEFHKQMYVYNADESPNPAGIDSDKIFSKAYTEDEINAQLGSLYSKAPQVVQDRRSRLKTAVQDASTYFDKYHVLEKHTFG